MISGRAITWAGLAVAAVLLGSAPAVRAQPLPSARPTTRFPDEPAGEFSLPTDGLMAPAQPVRPRTSFQPPARDPGGIPYEPDFTLPNGAVIPTPQSKQLRVQYIRRYGTPQTTDTAELPDGTTRILFTGGVIINVSSLDGKQQTEFATDEAVLWVRRDKSRGLGNDLVTGGDSKTEVEAYLSGNVIVRTVQGTKTKPATMTLRAEQVYYDASQNRAIALRGDLEMAVPSAPDPFHLRGAEIRRLDAENWEALTANANASKLPSDPGLRLDSERFTLNERRAVRRNVFGIPFRDLLTGKPVEITEMVVTGTNVVTRLGGVPVFYTPRTRFNPADPLGPITGLGFSQNRIFGTQFYSSFDMFELLAVRPPPGQIWRLNADYLSARGPALGTDYRYRLPADQPGEFSPGSGQIKLFGIEDKGVDILGGNRGTFPAPPYDRGRALWRHQQEVIDGLYYQGQFAYLSDPNFLEQYYKQEFDLGPNQETFAYLAWRRRNFEATALVEDRVLRNFATETNWLPKVEGALVGQTFFDDLFVYSARGTAGYAQLRPTEYNPYPILATDKKVDTGRFDVIQELSVPFALGPVKLAPYGVLDLTEYTSDLNGNETGRVYGGGGVRASVPFSRLYGDASSELLNVRGLYHKAVFGANYRYARSNVPYNQLPQLDRLNDDAVDQAYRNITPYQSQNVPGPDGVALMNSPGYSRYNPQQYAIRRLVDNRADTLDTMNVLQMDLRQRLQTKRGYPGMEHTVDFLTLDVSASYFPEATRDNFGHPFGFLEYGTIWNIGDRTAVVSNGWFEPYEGGSRYWNAGVYLDRTDRSSVYLGYRQTDPLNSKAVVVSLNYQLSPRYYASIGASYDFGLQQALSNSLTLTRTGSDLTMTVGFTYNAFVNNFGFTFLVVPNLASALGGRFAGTPLSNQQLNGRR